VRAYVCIRVGSARDVYQSVHVEVLLQGVLERVSVGRNIENDGRLCGLHRTAGRVGHSEFRREKTHRHRNGSDTRRNREYTRRVVRLTVRFRARNVLGFPLGSATYSVFSFQR